MPVPEERQRWRHDATPVTQALRWALGAILSVWLCGAQASQATSATPSAQTDQAAQAASAAPDPALDKRVEALAQELRCLVCQNQTIADSQAPLAVELKKQVYEQLARGQSDQDVIDFMVQRYGDFVLYRPPLKAATWLLWFGPFLLLALGLLALVLKLRQKPAPPESPSAAEQAELAQAAALLTGQQRPPQLPQALPTSPPLQPFPPPEPSSPSP
jgi:cytochrome c-type biogenesis protein CcmH